ncbi:MAG TPA: hypothetical protein VIH59_31005 [Candidatus Tectomicrobia bacterium]|jgi:hypothetical protein
MARLRRRSEASAYTVAEGREHYGRGTIAGKSGHIAPDVGYDRAMLMQPEVMQAPVVWLASDAAHAVNGRRVIAYSWNERLPCDERLTGQARRLPGPTSGDRRCPHAGEALGDRV